MLTAAAQKQKQTTTQSKKKEDLQKLRFFIRVYLTATGPSLAAFEELSTVKLHPPVSLILILLIDQLTSLIGHCFKIIKFNS